MIWMEQLNTKNRMICFSDSLVAGERSIERAVMFMYQMTEVRSSAAPPCDAKSRSYLVPSSGATKFWIISSCYQSTMALCSS